jgi:hypothetical protein
VADEAIVHILNNAIASVRSGELRGTHGPDRRLHRHGAGGT